MNDRKKIGEKGGWTIWSDFLTDRMEKEFNEWNSCYGTAVGKYRVLRLEKGGDKVFVLYDPSGAPIVAQSSLEGMDLFMDLYKRDIREDADLVGMVERGSTD